MTTLFVDGSHGTVGLALQPHLDQLQAEGLITQAPPLPEEHRKDTAARAAAYRNADLVVLCLPDALAADAAALALSVNPNVRILDASAAHRCQSTWLYGLPELPAIRRKDFRNAQLVANPGCFATGCILMSQPLVEWRPGCGWVEPSFAFQGMTGYSAAGHKGRPGPMRMAQLGTPHRHLAEIAHFSDVEPMLTTAIGGWERGMMVQTTVKLPLAHALAACQAAYAGMPDIQVRLATEGPAIHAEMHNGTNQLTLALAEQPYGGTTLVAAYDNLGKGSAGAAADNLRRMLA